MGVGEHRVQGTAGIRLFLADQAKVFWAHGKGWRGLGRLGVSVRLAALYLGWCWRMG